MANLSAFRFYGARQVQRQRRFGRLAALEGQPGQRRFRGGIAFEIGPAVPLEIVELADAAQFQVLPGRPPDDCRMLLTTLLQQALALGQVIKRNPRVYVMGGMVHDVVDDPFDRERKNDVRRALELHVVEGTLLRIVVPRQLWKGVLNERYKSNE